ncbi:MAG TPA: hypothetical protein VE264_03445 [Nitrososphaera sp.]|nr:hypothetical protein [Nitrososphaera sp.]
MGANNQFIQCRTCDAAYCILCGERIAMVFTRGDHGVGKCIKSRQVIQGYEEGEEKLHQN